MGSTVLFSAVQEAEVRFPLFVSEMRAFFVQQGLAVGSSSAAAQLASRLEIDTSFTEDLISMLRVVYAEEPGVSYLELLGLVLAAAGMKLDEPILRDDSEGDARHIFNFLVEHRRVMKAESETLSQEFVLHEYADDANDTEAASPLLPQSEPISPSAQESSPEPILPDRVFSPGKPNTALARALAISADEDTFSERSREIPVEPVEAGVPLEDGPVPRPRPVPVLTASPSSARPLETDPKMTTSSSSNARAWIAGLGGVVLGLLLGLLFHEVWRLRQPIAPTPEVALKSETPTPAPAHASRTPHASHASSMVSAAPSRDAASVMRDRPPNGAAARTTRETRPGSAVNRPSTSLPAIPTTAPNWSALGNAPAAPLRPGTVHEVRLNAPADLSASQARSGSRSGRVFVGSAGIMAAYLISSPAPLYPAQASAARVQGEVVVEAVVGRDGNVVSSRIVSGPPLLRQAALNAVQRWRYRPYEVDGETSEIATTARLSFQLDGP